jgi:hypothetical protein
MKTGIVEQWAARSRSLALLAGCLAGISTTAMAQNEAGAPTVVEVTQTGKPPTGPMTVIVEHDPSLAAHTIYRPSDLGSARHPVLVWGEGGCAKNGLMFTEYLSEIASYGFVIIADGPPGAPGAGAGGPNGPAARGGGAPPGGARAGGPGGPGGPGARGAAPRAGGPPAGLGNMVNGTDLVAAIDWLEGQASSPSSRFYNKVDVSHVAAMGMSCGGLMSYGASDDPRVATVGIWNSGLFEDEGNQKIYDGIHGSVIIVTGGDSDIAHDNGKRDFEVMPARIPVFYGVYPAVGHGGTYNQDNGGPFGVTAVAWLRWQLMGDTSATGRGYFVGDNCGICKDSNWEVQSRSLR